MMVPNVAIANVDRTPVSFIPLSAARERVEAALVGEPTVSRQLSIFWAAVGNLNSGDERALVRLDLILTDLLLATGDAVATAAQGAGGAS